MEIECFPTVSCLPQGLGHYALDKKHPFKYEQVHPIGAWKCNFRPFIKLRQTDQPNDQQADMRVKGKLHIQKNGHP